MFLENHREWINSAKYQKRDGSSRMTPWKNAANEKRRVITSLRERIKKARNKWLDDELTKEEYEETKEDSQNQIHALEAEISELRKNIENRESIPKNMWLDKLLKEGKISELDRITVTKLVSQIEIFSDRTIRITYNFREK